MADGFVQRAYSARIEKIPQGIRNHIDHMVRMAELCYLASMCIENSSFGQSFNHMSDYYAHCADVLSEEMGKYFSTKPERVSQHYLADQELCKTMHALVVQGFSKNSAAKVLLPKISGIATDKSKLARLVKVYQEWDFDKQLHAGIHF